MKPIYFLQAAFYTYLIYLGFTYLEVEASTIEELSRTKWSEARDAMEMATMLFYTKIWLICSVGTLPFALFLYKKSEIGKSLIVGGTAASILLILWVIWMTESNLKSNYVMFALFASIQIGTNIFFLLEHWIVPFISRNLKQVFFLIGMLYIGIFALKSCLLNLRNSITATIEEVGIENYTGLEASFPVNVFFFITIFIAFFAFTLPMYSVDNNDERLDEGVRSMLTGLRYSLFFSCSYSQYVFDALDENGVITSNQLFGLGTLTLVMIFAFILSVKTKYKKPKKFHHSNILDDSF